MDGQRVKQADPFLVKYQPSELKFASEFLFTWLPFLTRDLCSGCTHALSDRIRSLEPEVKSVFEQSNLNKSISALTTKNTDPNLNKSISALTTKNTDPKEEMADNHNCNCDATSLGSGNDDVNSLGSWKDGEKGLLPTPVSAASTSALVSELPSMESATSRMSWADMAQEDELEEEEDEKRIGEDEQSANVTSPTGESRITEVGGKTMLSREQRESIRFMQVRRKKDFISLERIKGRFVNVLDGLELHEGIFSAAEQKRIVDCVYKLEEQGRNKELKERTFTAPQKWMRGKGRVTIQFGCCYNYATDKNGNPPGILYNEMVDPIPPLFKVIIKRLVQWHVLPPTCVPDSCIVNIYEEGDCIPPHIDNHDFVRPFCTLSFLSECNILFGSNLKILGPGEFSGLLAIPLPVGSALVLQGNSADVAKHCVPAVPTKRISITFRRMDESRRPADFTPDPDLLGIKPLPYVDQNNNHTYKNNSSNNDRSKSPRSDQRHARRQSSRRGSNFNATDAWVSGGRIEPRSEPRYSSQSRGSSGSWRRPG